MPNRSSSDFKPSTWTKEVKGKTQTREALTPSDAVFYEFEGWRRVDSAKAKAAADSKTDTKADSKADTKPANRP